MSQLAIRKHLDNVVQSSLPTTQFFVTGLPRSGTTWMANYLTYGPSFCWHDGWLNCKNIEDMLALMDAPFQYVGNSDSFLPFSQDQMIQAFPDCQWVVIRRDPSDVEKSLRRLFPNIVVDIHQGLLKLEKLIEATHAKVVEFCDIFDQSIEVEKYLFGTSIMPQSRRDMLRDCDITPTSKTLTSIPDSIEWLTSIMEK